MKDFIGVYEDFASQEFCDSVISYFENMSDRCLSHSRLENGEGDTTMRDDESVHMSYESTVTIDQTKFICKEFDRLFWCNAYADYASKYPILKDAATHSVPHLKVQRTKVGGGYHVWHFETMSTLTSHRIMAFVLYLNDVKDGGETEFLYYPRRIKPKAGTLVIFPAGYTHTHRGNQPLTNTKYILTGWVEY